MQSEQYPLNLLGITKENCLFVCECVTVAVYSHDVIPSHFYAMNKSTPNFQYFTY